ncbi:unnamed protein product [Durusdinium trenchii]|uniref:Glycosyl transferase CAP10 domain-containing protein n=1 Tax=Durusdinium trenchii TaxID=1381693 RepID=A0ABP0PQ31_9DINO
MLLRPSTDPVEGPKSLVFHLITSTELAPVVSRALITVLPVLGAQLQVHSDALVQKRIKSTSAEKKTGVQSKEEVLFDKSKLEPDGPLPQALRQASFHGFHYLTDTGHYLSLQLDHGPCGSWRPDIMSHGVESSLISYRSSSGARKGLASAFNFAPFYLEENQSPKAPKSLEVSRLIYLDTDVLLLGDIEALWKVDMKGLPAAAVEDCSQSFDPQQNVLEEPFAVLQDPKSQGEFMSECDLDPGPLSNSSPPMSVTAQHGEPHQMHDKLFSVGRLQHMAAHGKRGLSKKDCVFNRGIFVMDDLYKFGMSQPPWLLALHKKYHKLGFATVLLSEMELKELKTELHLDFKALQKARETWRSVKRWLNIVKKYPVGARAMGDQAQPYIAQGVLLQRGTNPSFQWEAEAVAEPPMGLSPSGRVSDEDVKTFPTLEKKSVLDMSFVRCADIWSNFLSMPAAELLNSTAQQFYRFQCGRNGSSDGGVSEMVLGRLAALGAIGAHAQSLEESPEAGNGLCWYNSDRSYDRCCRQRDPDCWVGIWVTADLCCYNITQQQQECFDSMEMRVESKLRRLHDMAEMAEEEGLMEQAYMSRVQASSYEILLSQPLSMWSWACSVPDSPFLWSPDCACCEPEEGHCKRPDELFVQKAFLSCCYSVYARRTFEEPEEALEAQIQRHLEPLRPSRAAIQRLGPTLSWHLGGASRAHGCVISIHPNGSITTCPEEVACHGFDCSFLRAVVLALEVIQAIHPLPPLDFVLNAGDETLENTLLEAPVFTRGGTWWTHTLTLPFEWQMHPTQCVRTIKVGMNAMGLIKWEDRKPILIWRGSHSNLWTPHCKIYRAAREFHMLERCVTSLPPHGSPREPIWNFSTWLQMPRGRLIMLSRFVDFVDAKLVDSKLVPMSPDLESFLREEQLYGERIEAEALAQYKYHIAIEGNCAADRVCWQPFLGSVLLLPDGPWQQLPTVRTMEPWVHYVPVLYDLSDLVDKLLWLRAHDAEAKQIALNAVAFAHRHLTCDGNIYYLDRLFRAYAAKLVP